MDSTLPVYNLLDPDLLRRLMQRTGDGTPVSIRTLASAAGVHHSLIGSLLTGERTNLPAEAAHRATRRLGVDVLVLFTPTGRTVPAQAPARNEAMSA